MAFMEKRLYLQLTKLVTEAVDVDPIEEPNENSYQEESENETEEINQRTFSKRGNCEDLNHNQKRHYKNKLAESILNVMSQISPYPAECVATCLFANKLGNDSRWNSDKQKCFNNQKNDLIDVELLIQ